MSWIDSQATENHCFRQRARVHLQSDVLLVEKGWREWHRLTGLPYAPRHKSVHLQDANTRLQAVISGHDIALLDDLVKPEIESG